jgi:hypothetical protein
MSMHVRCKCGKRVAADKARAGEIVRCQSCGAALVVPSSAEDESTQTIRAVRRMRRRKRPLSRQDKTAFLVGGIGVAVLAIALSIIFACGFGGTPYQAAAVPGTQDVAEAVPAVGVGASVPTR